MSDRAQRSRHRLTIMISSTARDLPLHREKVMHACLRAGHFPLMMEHLPASDAEVVAASLRMVEEADVYLVLVGHRYGHIPDGQECSITEMEYNRAVEIGIPRLTFIMHEEHALTFRDIETGEAARRVEDFRLRLSSERVVGFFKSADDLLALALQALEESVENIQAASIAGEAQFHGVVSIPLSPEPYVAHSFTLLQTRGLVGRRSELEVLTDWISRPDSSRVMSVVAIGGMGKSALTWHWFHEIAPQEARRLNGRIWWSFYESDASYENFVTRALAYVSRCTTDDVSKLTFSDRESALLSCLDREPFLLILDGLERLLVAYTRADAARMLDDDLDEATSNRVAGALGLSKSAAEAFLGAHPLRRAADRRAGLFLRRLASVRASRTLASTRLFPADLQTSTGEPRPYCSALFLSGLSDQDALELWRAQGARGSREEMLPYFHLFENHPLLLQVLAGEVARFRPAPGDFDAWRLASPGFNPFTLPLVQVKTHVLEHALKGLSNAERRTLDVLAAFRMPTGFDTLRALLLYQQPANGQEGMREESPQPNVEDSRPEVPLVDPLKRPFNSLSALDAALSELEDRGLFGWDRRVNRYDLHPVVRGVVWSTLTAADRTDLHDELRAHFEAFPSSYRAKSLDDLAPAIELFHILVELGRFEDAVDVFRSRLDDETLYRLSASRERAELLERLFPAGTASAPQLEGDEECSWAIHALAQSWQLGGHPGAAAPLFERCAIHDERLGDKTGQTVALRDLSDALRCAGELYGAEVAAKTAIGISRSLKDIMGEAVGLKWLGLILWVRGEMSASDRAFKRSMTLFHRTSPGSGKVMAYLAEHSLRKGGNPQEVLKDLRAAQVIAEVQHHEADFIRIERIRGLAFLHLGDLAAADECLCRALARARACQRVEEELPILVALSEVEIARSQLDLAREYLEGIWELAEGGPFPLFHADALNVLVRLEIGFGRQEAAIHAALRARERAWCDGPPFTYYWGLREAQQRLREFGVTEPALPSFEELRREPMPMIEIEPDAAPDPSEPS